jgi:endoglucanase
MPACLRRLFAVLLFFLVSFQTAAHAQSVSELFTKGINIARLHNLPIRDPQDRSKYLWPPFQGDLAQISDEEINGLKDVGFTFIRLPVAPRPFLTVSDGDRQQLEDGLFKTIDRFQSAGLAVLLDPHPTHRQEDFSALSILDSPGDDTFMAYVNWITSLATRLRERPSELSAMGLMNEPQIDCYKRWGNDWTDIQPVLFEAVRAAAPDLTIAVTTGCWSSYRGLTHLDMSLFDDNTLIDLHFYTPYIFTHQSLPFASSPARYVAGLEYPATADELEGTVSLSKDLIALRRSQNRSVSNDALKEAEKGIRKYYLTDKVDRLYLKKRFDPIENWRVEQGLSSRRILIGEFGAARAPKQLPKNIARYNWIRDVRELAESFGFGFAYWDYHAGAGYTGFGIVKDNASRTLDAKALDALGLRN